MQKKMCEVCWRLYESEDHECREAMPACDGGMTREQAKYAYADAMLRARESAPAADPVREAAPDLLAALKSMNEAFRVDQTRFTAAQADAVRKMDAAIARATGEA